MMFRHRLFLVCLLVSVPHSKTVLCKFAFFTWIFYTLTVLFANVHMSEYYMNIYLSGFKSLLFYFTLVKYTKID